MVVVCKLKIHVACVCTLKSSLRQSREIKVNICGFNCFRNWELVCVDARWNCDDDLDFVVCFCLICPEF